MMKGFLKYTLATVTGIILASLFMLFIGIGIIGSLASQANKPVSIKSNSILQLKLNAPIVERNPNDFLENFNFMTGEPNQIIGFNELIFNIQKAKKDDKIKGIYLNLSVIQAGLSTVEEIRNALLDFKTSGKFIYAYSDVLDEKSYYLASIADSIFMNPAGYMELIGLASQIQFFKGTLDKLGIEIEIHRYGDYKSAGEFLVRKELSDENRQQIERIISVAWNGITNGISEARNIPVETINALADNLEISTSQSALDNKLIDGIIYRDEMPELLKKASGNSGDLKSHLVSLSKYNKTEVDKKKDKHKEKVAVIYAHGNVKMGEEGEGSIAATRISQAIKKAREDSTIKAIVLRVNSGGGSALASDIIWRETKLAQQTKPVIASFGDVAASGGYYIACAADTIVANPNTITGSIGVIGVTMNAQKFLTDKLGITHDVVKSNKHADMISVFKSMNSAEKKFTSQIIGNIYNDFISHVAEGRGISKEEVDKIGQGRVWMGEDALDIGLIDMYGGFTDAIDIAANAAGLEDYALVELPELKDPFEKFISEYMENAQVKLLKTELGEWAKYYDVIKEVTTMDAIQTRIPFEINLE